MDLSGIIILPIWIGGLKLAELIGFTIQDGIKGNIDEPILTLEDAKKVQEKDIWKIDWKNGKFKLRKTADGKVRATSLWATPKEPEPEEWFDFEGVVPSQSESKEILPGSRVNYPGVFLIIDKGKVEYGFSKDYMLEVFLDGKLKGRHIFRQLGVEELRKVMNGKEITDDDLIVFYKATKNILPPYDKEEAENPSTFTWLFIQSTDQTPYVLGEAVRKNLLPPLGYSALPKEIRKKIPDEYKYWLEKDRKKAIQMRNAILELDLITKNTGKFFLHRRYWLDPQHKINRFGPTEEVYDLTILDGNKLVHYSISEDPADSFGFAGYKTDIDKKIIDIKEQTKIEPKTMLNPSKNTPCWIELIDSGNCEIYQNSPEFLKVKFKGKVLNGLYTAKKEENTAFWLFETSKTPADTVLPIMKSDTFRGIVTGPVLIPDRVDRQGHIITKEEIEKAMFDFMRNSRNIGFMHQNEYVNDEVTILECAIQKGDYRLDNGRVIPDGTWYLTIEEKNPIRKELIKQGKIRGFSIRAFGRMKVIEWR